MNLPTGNKIQASIANNILKGKENGGGGVQFEIKMPKDKKVLDDWFNNTSPLN